jgi:uncharacterized protein YciI
MAEWIYFLHAPRDEFGATMTADEAAAFERHFSYLEGLLADGTLVLAGPTLGRINTGISVFEAPDEETARRIMKADPAVSSGAVRGELRPFRISLLRGRPR